MKTEIGRTSVPSDEGNSPGEVWTPGRGAVVEGGGPAAATKGRAVAPAPGLWGVHATGKDSGGRRGGQHRATGPGVRETRPRLGDDVFGDLSNAGFGGLGEYVCAPEALVCRKPAWLSYAEAAAIPLAGATALQALGDYGGVQAGQRVLVNGQRAAWATLPCRLPGPWERMRPVIQRVFPLAEAPAGARQDCH